jgi:hypothetical protein
MFRFIRAAVLLPVETSAADSRYTQAPNRCQSLRVPQRIVSNTADYLRATDLDRMIEDLQCIVKRYPGRSLAAAAIVGFLIARGLRLFS